MLQYFRKNPLVSFGFVAAPDLDKDIKGKRVDKKSGSRRFKFYQRMMINLFGPETFHQVSDGTTLQITKKLKFNYLAIFLSIKFYRVTYKVTYKICV